MATLGAANFPKVVAQLNADPEVRWVNHLGDIRWAGATGRELDVNRSARGSANWASRGDDPR